MKKKIVGLVATALLFALVSSAAALAPDQAKQTWIGAQKIRLSADAAYRQAVLGYQKDKTPGNDRQVIETTKTALNSVLDEVEAWLKWKQAEAQNDSRVPVEIKNNIEQDVAKNLEKIAGYRIDVAGIENRLQAAAVFLKMVGGYIELVTDVARNTGACWAYIGDQLVTIAEGYESQLRQAAADINDNAGALTKLDAVKSELALAKNNINLARSAYQLVKLPGTPLIKFAEGNNYLRQAQINLINAQAQLEQAFRLIVNSK